jgi:hypothetical protein
MIPISKVYKYYPKLKELLRNFSEIVNVLIRLLFWRRVWLINTMVI